MKSAVFLLLIFSLCVVLTSCAQTKSSVTTSHGFYLIPMRGTIPVGIDGQPVDLPRDSVFFLYVETPSTDVQWQGAWKDGRSFSVLPQVIKQAQVNVGTTKNDGEKVELSAKQGNTLWQIELSDDQKNTKAPQSIATGVILLKGLRNEKPFYVRINSLTELASPLYQ